MDNNKIINNNSYQTLSKINVDEYTETKMGLKYLSWAKAWSILKEHYPDAEYKIYSREIESTETKTITQDGISTTTVSTSTSEVPYFTDGKTCFVKVGVIINQHEEIEVFPVMDLKNNSVPYAAIKSVDINKALQRAFVKACARHGLGINVYTGEEFKDMKEEVATEGTNTLKTLLSVKMVPNTLKNATEFNNIKEQVINHITNTEWIQDKDKEAILAQFSTILNGTRVSQLEFKNGKEDIDKLNLINYIINNYHHK